MAFSEEVYNYVASRDLGIHGWTYTHFHTTNFVESGGAQIAKNYFITNAKSNNLTRYYSRQRKQYSSINNLSYIDEMFSDNNLAIFEQAIVNGLQESLNKVASGTTSFGDDFSRMRNTYRNLFNQGLPSFKRTINFLTKTSQILNRMSQQGGAILLELAQQLKNAGQSNYNLINLSRQINQAISSLNNSGIINYDTQITISLLEELNQAIQQAQTNGGISSSKFSNSLKQMFNTNLGEGIVGMAVADLGSQTEKNIIEYLTGKDKRISYTGSKEVQIKPDAYGEYIVPIEGQDNLIYNIKLPVAPSTKFYSKRGLYFLGGYGAHDGNLYSLILKTSAPKIASNRTMSYLLFNTIGASEKNTSLVTPLSYFIVKNLGVELLTGSGKMSLNNRTFDQANVLVANGKIYSMSDLLRKIDQLNYNQMNEDLFKLKFKGEAVKGAWVPGEGRVPAYNRAKKASRSMFNFQVKMNFYPNNLID